MPNRVVGQEQVAWAGNALDEPVMKGPPKDNSAPATLCSRTDAQWLLRRALATQTQRGRLAAVFDQFLHGRMPTPSRLFREGPSHQQGQPESLR